jgi:glycosyltransferase involved in cell wall biosynthesis
MEPCRYQSIRDGGTIPERAGRAPAARGLVVSALFFFPRGGSAQVTRSLARALPAAGWQPTLAAGSLGQPGEPTHAASFFARTDVHALDYSPALELAEPLAAPVPFQPSYEDRPDAPDRVFAAVDDAAYERLAAAWIELLARAGAGAADLLHLHHLTPANEAAARGFPSLPVLGQLHGTELAMLRRIEAGAPPGWLYAQDWGRRLRAWARRCALLVVPPGAEADAALLLGLERAKLHGLPSGVELERFSRRPLAKDERLAFWRRWLVEQPRGWDESGRPGSIAYRDKELAPFRAGGPVFLYVGRYTAVKRLPLLISAHARAVERLGKPAPLVLVGGHPGEWEGEHPLATARRIGNRQVFLAGWRPHEELPQALNAADALVLPLRRRGLRARPRRGDGLRPTGDCLPGAWPGGDRCRRKDGLAHSARRRGGARRLAPRRRLRSGGAPGAWPTRSDRQPPIRLGGDRPSLRVPVRGAARLLSRAAACAGAARLSGAACAVQVDESLTDLAALPRISNSEAAVLAHLTDPLIVEPFDGLAERRQPVSAAVRDLRRIKDSLGLVSSQGDRVGGVLDQPELDRIGDSPSSYGPFGARFVCRLHPQVLRHQRRRPLVERVPLAGDLEHDLHSAEPISGMVGVL